MLRYPTLSRILPFATFIALMMVEALLEWVAPNFHDSAKYAFYPIRVFVTLAVLVWLWFAVERYRLSFAGLSASSLAIAVLLGAGVIAFWIGVGPLFRVGEPSNGNPIPQDALYGKVWLISRFLGAVFVVPIIEELFWRSYLARRIDAVDIDSLNPSEISWRAVIATSVVFSLAHREVVAGVVAGIAFCWLYKRRGDLREAVLAHAVANALLFAYVWKFSAFEFWG
jgi:uncharacterized protein